MNTLGITHSACGVCRQIVPAKILSDGADVLFEKFCPEHGLSRHLVRRDVEDYLRTLRYVKPAWVPRQFAGSAASACPTGCGFCPRHEQHLCMPIVEITSQCDLACPACLVDAGRAWDLGRTEFARLLDGLIAAERQIDVLNLSGGEPLLHPQLLDLVDDALARPEIIRVSISTNGLRLLHQPQLLESLRQRNVVISLQLDGFSEKPYEILRGRPLLEEKLRILELLKESGGSTSLTMTAAGGVNDDQFGPVLDYFFAHLHLVSLMIQPLAFTGRGAALATRWGGSCTATPGGDSTTVAPTRAGSRAASRLTIPDVVRLLEQSGSPRVRAADFVPLPCSHPLCFSLAFYLMLDGGGSVAVSTLLDAGRWLDNLANRTVFGLDEAEHQQLKDMIYEIWSGPAGAVPDAEAVMKTLRSMVAEMSCSCFDPREAFAMTERRVKSIFIHAFQDAETFDLARVRRCCNAYPQPDGRLIPACVHNVLRRPEGSCLADPRQDDAAQV